MRLRIFVYAFLAAIPLPGVMLLSNTVVYEFIYFARILFGCRIIGFKIRKNLFSMKNMILIVSSYMCINQLNSIINRFEQSALKLNEQF